MAVRKQSAGILLVRMNDAVAEFLLVHPGGPFWAKKDAGAWSIPKGEYGPDEEPRACAVREFREELGVDCPTADLIDLGEITQSGGKHVIAFAGIGDIDVDGVSSNTFEIEWPPRSGRRQEFPEVDRAGFFTMSDAENKVLAAQRPFLERAVRALADGGPLL